MVGASIGIRKGRRRQVTKKFAVHKAIQLESHSRTKTGIRCWPQLGTKCPSSEQV